MNKYVARLIRVAGCTSGVCAASVMALALVPAAANAASTVCQNNSAYPGGKTCIQLVATGYGSYSITATGTTTSATSSAYLTLTGPGGSTQSSTPAKLAAKGTATYSSGDAAGAGTWCATFSVKIPLFGATITATKMPAPCVTVPPLPAPPGTSAQQCLDPTEFPQFETCIDVVDGAVVAKGYAATNVPSAYLTLTGPGGYSASSTPAALAAGTILKFTGPSPAPAGQWCASFYGTFPALGFALDVTGKTPVCLTV